MSKETKTYDVSEFRRRAVMSPDTLDAENRTVDVVFCTENRVLTSHWDLGNFYEILSCDPAHVRMDRINSGAPVLDTHDKWGGVKLQLGVVEPGSAKLNNAEGIAKLRFSKRDDVEPVFQDVADKILQNISVGYRVFRYQEEPKVEGDTIPTYRAIDWEPFEISLASIPADLGSKIRDNNAVNHKLEIITLNSNIMSEESKRNQEDGAPPAPPASEVPPTPPASETVNENERKLAIEGERKRVMTIRDSVRSAKLPEEFADKLINDGTTVDKARELIIAKFAENDPHAGSRSSVEVTRDETVQLRSDIEAGLMHRCMPATNPVDKLTTKAREFTHMSMMDLAREMVDLKGTSTRGMSRNEILSRALTTTDYPHLLGNVVNRILRGAYEAPPQTWRQIARQMNGSDFKQMKAVQFGGNLMLQEVKESGEFKRVKMSEAAETWNIKTYGRIVAISRQAIINDDLGGFTRVAELFGMGAANMESDIMWALITGNPTMADGKALFIASGHSNLAGTGGAPSVTTLSAARAAMRKQTGLDGEKLNIRPMFIIVPPDLETDAEKLVSPNLLPSESDKVNPFANKLQVIAEPRLSDTYAWYMAASPTQIDMLAYSYLDGASGLTTEYEYGFEVDGVNIKVREDFGGVVLDHRGLYKNAGH